MEIRFLCRKIQLETLLSDENLPSEQVLGTARASRRAAQHDKQEPRGPLQAKVG